MKNFFSFASNFAFTTHSIYFQWTFFISIDANRILKKAKKKQEQLCAQPTKIHFILSILMFAFVQVSHDRTEILTFFLVPADSLIA